MGVLAQPKLCELEWSRPLQRWPVDVLVADPGDVWHTVGE